MRITSKLLRTNSGVHQCNPLSNIEYLDLTYQGIVLIERLNQCPKLHTLLLTGNQIDVLENVDKCPELWKLDVSDNKLRYLDGLLPFVGLGTLNLSNNQLQWSELEKIRHMYLLDVHLHGNPELEKDPNYRLHVIDCLPYAWAVDGRPVTSSERCQVAHFFQKSACSNQPVRHKLTRDRLLPTSRQVVHLRGVYGKRVSELYALFPTDGSDPNHVTDTSDTDRNKLWFCAKNLQEELRLDVKFRKKDYQVCRRQGHFMEELLSLRPDDRESSNMLLLLLVASLEFVLPITLVENTLEVTRLDKVGSIDTMNVFLLPREMRWSVAVILLTAAKLDREAQQNGGLYEQLYLCIHCVLVDLVRVRFVDDERAKSARAKPNTMKKDHRSLLAAELVQLLCIVPVFFQLLDSEMGLMNLIIAATGDSKMIDKLSQLVNNIPSTKDISRVYLGIADHLMAAMQHHSTKLFTRSYNHRKNIEPHLMGSTSPVRPLSSSIHKSEYLTSGRSLPGSPRRVPSGKLRKAEAKTPCRLGDAVLLGPQTVGRVVSLPQTDVVMVQMSAVPVANGAMMSGYITKTSTDFFRYVNTGDLEWDAEAGYWRPKGTVGDRITIQSIYERADDILESSVSNSYDPRNSAPQNTPLDSTGSLVVAKTQPAGEVAARQPIRLYEFPRPISCLLAEKLDLKLDINGTDDKHRPFTAQARKAQQEEESSLFKAVQDAVVNVAANLSSRRGSTEHPPSSVIDQNKAAGKTISGADDAIVVVPSNDEQDDVTTLTETSTGDIVQATHDGDEVPSNDRRHDNAESTWTEIEQGHNLLNGGNREAMNGLNEAASKIMQFRFRNEGESVTISEAYRYLINKPERQTRSAYARPDHVAASRALIGQFREAYKTPYQFQRTESWKRSAWKSPKNDQLLSPAPPPQRPSSPSAPQSPAPSERNDQLVVIDSQNSCIRRVDRWLGGGKDLYTEELQNRPRHKSQPGWKDGIRANSAVIRTRARPQTALTPSAMKQLSSAYATRNGYNPRDPATRDGQKRPRDQMTRSRSLVHTPRCRRTISPNCRILLQGSAMI